MSSMVGLATAEVRCALNVLTKLLASVRLFMRAAPSPNAFRTGVRGQEFWAVRSCLVGVVELMEGEVVGVRRQKRESEIAIGELLRVALNRLSRVRKYRIARSEKIDKKPDLANHFLPGSFTSSLFYEQSEQRPRVLLAQIEQLTLIMPPAEFHRLKVSRCESYLSGLISVSDPAKKIPTFRYTQYMT